MIIKSLLEIAFYSSLLVVKKIGSTIEENIPFTQNKKEKVAIVPTKKLKTRKKEQDEDNQVSKKEKGSTPKENTEIKSKEAKSKEIKSKEIKSKEITSENKTSTQQTDKKETVKLETVKQEIHKKDTHTKETQPTKLDYSTKTKKELYHLAQEMDLEGRSTMSKAQLIKALKNQ